MKQQRHIVKSFYNQTAGGCWWCAICLCFCGRDCSGYDPVVCLFVCLFELRRGMCLGARLAFSFVTCVAVIHAFLWILSQNFLFVWEVVVVRTFQLKHITSFFFGVNLFPSALHLLCVHILTQYTVKHTNKQQQKEKLQQPHHMQLINKYTIVYV